MLYGEAMIVGTGIDIAEVDRIAKSIERFGRRFIERVFTPEEIRYCESKANKTERYAARFAAKEAAMKAIGTGWNRGVTWKNVEVQRLPGGRPTVAFHGRAADFFVALGGKRAHLSITHTETVRDGAGDSGERIESCRYKASERANARLRIQAPGPPHLEWKSADRFFEGIIFDCVFQHDDDGRRADLQQRKAMNARIEMSAC